MSEQLQPGNTIASIAAYEAENRNLNQMAQILSQSTGIPVATILSARQSWLSQAANA